MKIRVEYFREDSPNSDLESFMAKQKLQPEDIINITVSVKDSNKTEITLVYIDKGRPTAYSIAIMEEYTVVKRYTIFNAQIPYNWTKIETIGTSTKYMTGSGKVAMVTPADELIGIIDESTMYQL